MTPSNDTRPSGVGEALLALAERCEKASGASFMLDAEIGLATFGVRTTDVDGVLVIEGRATLVKPYTASIDAAMTLIPEEARLLALTEAMRVEGCATIWFAKLAHADRKGGFPATQSATPALALTAAALRVRYAARAQEQHP